MRYLLLLVLLVSIACTQDKPKPDAGNVEYGSITLNPAPDVAVQIGGGLIIEVHDKEGKLMIRIDREGHSTVGDGYHPDAGAKTFWEAMAKYYPSVCAKPDTVAPKEGQPK